MNTISSFNFSILFLIAEWDKLAKNNENNKHNLSTSKRQDWVDELLTKFITWQRKKILSLNTTSPEIV